MRTLEDYAYKQHDHKQNKGGGKPNPYKSV